MVFEKLFKMILKVLKQYTNKFVLWRKNLFISSLLKGFSKILLGHQGKAQFVISVKLSWPVCYSLICFTVKEQVVCWKVFHKLVRAPKVQLRQLFQLAELGVFRK